MNLNRFIKQWNELWLSAALFILWPVVPVVLRWLDPTAAPFDAGVLHTLYITMLIFAAIHGFVWIGIKLNFRLVWNFFETNISYHFYQLTSWQRILFCFSVFALYILATVLVFLAVAGMA